MVYRHHDYLLRIPSVPAGGVKDVPLSLDSDAPFALRLVRSRNIGASGWNFQTPRRAYQSTKLRTDTQPLFSTTNSAPTPGAIIYPQQVFPINSSIVVDIGNNTGAPILDAQLLFRGSKIYRDEQAPAAAYPASISPLTFTYGLVVPNVAPFGLGSRVLNNQLAIDSDADFVIRCGVADPFTLGVDGGPTLKSPIHTLGVEGAPYNQVYVQLKDEAQKPYSNVPIHINDLFGQGKPTNANDLQVLFQPTLYSPEIYLPALHAIYVDVYRQEDPADPVTFRDVDLHFRFNGSKVFWR